MELVLAKGILRKRKRRNRKFDYKILLLEMKQLVSIYSACLFFF